MIVTEIPEREPLKINHVVLDYSGTVTVDGVLLRGVKERIARLKELAHVYVLTTNTYGTVMHQYELLGITVRTFPREGAAGCEEGIVKGPERGVTCPGNGFNDTQMFDVAQLSIAVLEREDICVAPLSHASVMVRSIKGGLDLLLKPDRLRVALRS